MTEHQHNCSCGCKSELETNGLSRKDFLKKIGAAGIGMGLAPLAAFSLTAESGKSEEINRSMTVRAGKAQRITLLHTSDIHGQVTVHDEFFWENGKAVYKKRGGFAHLKTLVKTLRKENPDSLLVDGGDCFQGSALAALTEGQAMIPLMNNLGYDLMLPGNWEVVYGKNKLIEDMNGYQARKVCSNMYHELNEQLIFPSYQVFRFGEIKLGFLGYNDPLTPQRQPPAFSAGMKFTHAHLNIAENVKHLRTVEKCDLVFAMTHMGMAQQLDLASQPYCEGIDYILGADTHERIRQPLQGRYAKVTEPGAFCSFVGKLDLVIENGKIKDESYELVEVDPDRFKPDPEMEALLEKAHEPIKKNISTVVGQTRTPIVRYFVMETPMDNLITDALMWKVKPDISLSSGYRFCPPLAPSKNETIDITREYLWSMLPVNSEVRVAEIDGEQIWNWLEFELENVFAKDPARRFGGWLVRFQGMKIKFKIQNEFKKRLLKVTVQGKKLDLKKTYRVAACEREGDPENVLCRIRNVKHPRNLGYSMHEVLEEYLLKHSPVSPRQNGRAVAVDADSTLLSQVSGINYQFR